MRKGLSTAWLSILVACGVAYGVACGGSSTTVGGGGSDDAGSADDAAAQDDAGSSGGADSGPVEAVCTSGKTWGRGDQGSQLMHPGMACINCHSQRRAPRFTIAGTVYPTAHEPDDCIGASGYKVVITDANGKETSVTTNSAGNFFLQTAIATPFHAKVVDSSGKERAMVAAQTVGDCNSCHTVDGTNSAPGRIQAP